ncbi:MAG: pyridoxal phosphate-dependent aminotransferase [Thermoanaerobaculales bacterium]|jgi:aspartate/methionine/tyrosine aminotransferase|nr:pyridoxal phosphate-dependent aminotransferase [Thermoanaerobaculales bacterium]
MRRALDDVVGALGRFAGPTIDLLVGEPCFGPPVEITTAFERSAREPAAGYGPPAGIAELRRVLAGWAGAPGPDEVVVTHGAKGGLLALLAALVGPGDEVVHPVPCYPGYPAIVRRLGGVPVGVAEGDRLRGWAEAVGSAIGPRTRAVVLSSPSNPTGSVLDDAELEALAGLCREHRVRLVLDEVYAAFRFDGRGRGRRDPTVDDGIVVRIGSASKVLAVPGWRVGWVIADRALAGSVAEHQAVLLNPPATPPQRALLALPEVPEATFEANRRAVCERLEALAGSLRRVGIAAALPAGGFYLWVDLRERLAGEPTTGWCVRLAGELGVGVWPGEDFGAPGHVRLALPRGDGWESEIGELERRLRSSAGARGPARPSARVD